MNEEIIKRIYAPEYYMEIQEYDIRLGMSRFNSFIRILGQANLSLIYSDESEHNIDNVKTRNIMCLDDYFKK